MNNSPDPDDPTEDRGGTEGRGDRRSPDIDDPLERLERNERSSRHAVTYVLVSCGVVLVTAILLRLVLDFDTAPCPGPEQLCTSGPRVQFVLIPTLLSITLTSWAMWETYRRWRDHIRWRPWLFACQVLWIATTAIFLIAASIAFVGT